MLSFFLWRSALVPWLDWTTLSFCLSFFKDLIEINIIFKQKLLLTRYPDIRTVWYSSWRLQWLWSQSNHNRSPFFILSSSGFIHLSFPFAVHSSPRSNKKNRWLVNGFTFFKYTINQSIWSDQTTGLD